LGDFPKALSYYGKIKAQDPYFSYASEKIVLINQQMQRLAVNLLEPKPVETEKEKEKKEENLVRQNLYEVKSYMFGTFYRGKAISVGGFYYEPSTVIRDESVPFYVKEGDYVEVGDTLCYLGAMGLANEFEAEVSGRIEKILVEDESGVEYDQTLMLIDTDVEKDFVAVRASKPGQFFRTNKGLVYDFKKWRKEEDSPPLIKERANIRSGQVIGYLLVSKGSSLEKVTSKTDGQLIKFLKREGQFVQADEVVAYILPPRKET
jgi:biotin carboxyl carrier protein